MGARHYCEGLPMNEYKIALPVNSNSGAPYDKAREAWEGMALIIAGGYTREGSQACGAWMNAGHVYKEPMQGYTIAASREHFARLVGAAFDLFPDQLAIYTARGGNAEIIPRPKNEVSNG